VSILTVLKKKIVQKIVRWDWVLRLYLALKTRIERLRTWRSRRKMDKMFSSILAEANKNGEDLQDDTVIPKSGIARNRKTVLQNEELTREVGRLLATSETVDVPGKQTKGVSFETYVSSTEED
jgi:hypothetical protein